MSFLKSHTNSYIQKIIILLIVLVLRFPRVEAAEKVALPNFHPVTPHLYRGAQPTSEGLLELKKIGIKTILSLKMFYPEKKQAEKLGFQYKQISMKPWHPEEEDLIRFLKIVTDEKNTPVFVHCQHGADRTGMLVAIYRISVCGWDKERAIEEMKQKQFGFHPLWENLVEYIRKLDIEELKQKSGLGEHSISCE